MEIHRSSRIHNEWNNPFFLTDHLRMSYQRKKSYSDSRLFSTLKIPSIHKHEKNSPDDVCKQIYSEQFRDGGMAEKPFIFLTMIILT